MVYNMDDFSAPDLVSLKNSLKQRGVKYGVPSFVDIHGISKGKAVPVNHFEQMMRGSELFAGSVLDGMLLTEADEDLVAVPDPNSVTILPWNREIAWFASDLYYKGEPFEACSRSILKRVMGQASAMGYRLNLGVEAEFCVLKQGADGTLMPLGDRPPLSKPRYDLRGLLGNYPWLSALIEAMNDLDWDVYSTEQEDANGQFEVNFNYADAVKMSDRLTFFRLMINDILQPHGCFATFMPKPFANQSGNSAHFNLSLVSTDGGENLFMSLDDPYSCGLSKLGYQFIAGILRHAPALCAVMAPTVNSYKRLVSQGQMGRFTGTPIHIGYGKTNRTAMLRVPLGGGRVECRAVDSACNPYLSAAMLLAAGLEGIRDQLDPGKPQTQSLATYSPIQLQQEGIQTLPRTLGDAIEAFATDALSYEVMGAPMFQSYVDCKSQEWDTYRNQVSDWEVQRYLRWF
ncbi:MAG: type III glutamate--ammonia ligase [Kaiparowitsia implicata GSE-PSE-MK54-09C]|jgi:glutamine synthetase|nr:type III glutamate--ammonia ligase [Kaiparowitsia implicata GSE-PSE-MK54-09C]